MSMRPDLTAGQFVRVVWPRLAPIATIFWIAAATQACQARPRSNMATKFAAYACLRSGQSGPATAAVFAGRQQFGSTSNARRVRQGDLAYRCTAPTPTNAAQ